MPLGTPYRGVGYPVCPLKPCKYYRYNKPPPEQSPSWEPSLCRDEPILHLPVQSSPPPFAENAHTIRGQDVLLYVSWQRNHSSEYHPQVLTMPGWRHSRNDDW